MGNTNREQIGYWNGLICLLHLWPKPCVIEILNPSRITNLDVFRPSKNPSRVTSLNVFRPSKDGDIICYGFGFDSLTNEYKVVLIFRTTEEEELKYECLVFTLGTKSWRQTRMAPPLPSPHQLFSTRPSFKSAIFSDGALFWRTSSDELANEKMQLLSFDLHDETFRVIHVPDECVPMTMSTNQQHELVRLVEFKGSICVARLEKLLESKSSTGHQDQNTSSCCKVHLHFLKLGKLKQVWIKETFDVLPSLSLPCFNDTTATTTTSTTTTTTPRVRLVSFLSGRVLLYWLDSKECGGLLQLYDLQNKHLKVVRPSSLDDQDIFEKNDIVDFQLHSHIENFLPSSGNLRP